MKPTKKKSPVVKQSEHLAKFYILPQKYVRYGTFLLILLSLLFTFNRGIMLHDEGYILQAAERVLSGEKLYKDILITYTPGSVYSTAFTFWILGESIQSARILALVISISAVFVLFKIIRFITLGNIPLIGFLVLMIFVTFGPMHINFSWPVMYCILFGLLNLYLMYLIRENPKRLYFLFLGVTVAMAMLFKQNFGLALAVQTFLFLLILQRTIRNIINVGVGTALPIVLWISYLILTNTFSYALDNFSGTFFYNIVIRGVDATPFIYKDSLIPMVARSILYLLPAIVSILVLFKCYRAKSYYWTAVSLCLLYYIVGIRPATDYVHLVPLMALIGLPLLVLYKLYDTPIVKYSLTIFALLLILLGVYTALFKGYYRWESPLIDHRHFFSHPRVNIFVDGKYSQQLPEVLRIIDQNSKPEDYVYIDYYAFSLQFISNRNNPTPLIYLSPTAMDQESRRIIIASLEKKEVPLAITHEHHSDETSQVYKYIDIHYNQIHKVGDYIIWKRVK
jgi:4-amino-4-deoxy-L-arabinose transferase-like glycosyltransferase/sporulation protein YlmC with PRC-barrel domain